MVRAQIKERSSLSYISYRCWVGVSAWEIYPHGCKSPVMFFWYNTPPVPTREASVSIVKGLLGSGRSNVGSLRKAALSESNDVCSSCPHLHTVAFLVRTLRG